MSINVPSQALPDFDRLPDIGEEITLYEGPFRLERREVPYSPDEEPLIEQCFLTGRIYYAFLESIDVRFEGTTDSVPEGWPCANETSIYIEDKYVGSTQFYNLRKESDCIRLNGSCDFHFGTNTTCECWRWCFINLPPLRSKRLVFDAEGYRIILENREGYSKGCRRLREISHHCEIKRLDGTAFYSNDRIITAFFAYLAFFYGSDGVYQALLNGLNGSEIQYVCYETVYTPSRTFPVTWKPDYEELDLVAFWPKFLSMYWHPDLNCAEYVWGCLRGYVYAVNPEIQEPSGQEYFPFNDFEFLSRALRVIRNVNVKTLSGFYRLLHMRKMDTGYDHIPLDYDNREKFRLPDANNQYIMTIALQTLELGILYLLGYQGHYADRLMPEWDPSRIKRVPWARDGR